MASITEQPALFEAIDEEYHVMEFNFTVNNYNDIISLDYRNEHRIFCDGFDTEWTVWILFQKTNPSDPVSSIVSVSRTDEDEGIVEANLIMLLHNASTLESAEVMEVFETDIGRNWEFQKNIDPFLQSENAHILNDGNLDVKFCLAVYDCHEQEN